MYDKGMMKMQKQRCHAILAVYLVVIERDAVLLLLRQNTGYSDGMYSLPAGHIDPGESVKTAMKREAKEEIGIEIDPDDLTIACSMYRNADDDERMDFFLTVDRWKGEIKNMEPHKCVELKYFSINDLPNNLIPHVKMGIESSLNGISFVEYGWN